MSETILQYLGNRNPSLTDVIETDGVAQDLTGCTVKFRMRAVGSNVLKVDAAAVVVAPAANGNVRYDWAAADVDTAAFYLGWWQVTYASGKTQDKPEFLLEVRDHSTGLQLCDLADVRLAMETKGADDDLDARIQALIPDATREICDVAQREYLPTAGATRTFDVTGRHVDLAPYDLRTATTVTFDPDGSPVVLNAHVDYEPLPIGRDRDGVYTELKLSNFLSLQTTKMISFGHADVRVLGDWGMAAVPASIREAAVIAVKSWVRVADETYAQYDADMRRVLARPDGTFKLPAASLSRIDQTRRYPRGGAI